MMKYLGRSPAFRRKLSRGFSPGYGATTFAVGPEGPYGLPAEAGTPAGGTAARAGFMLIELAIAAFVIGLGILALLGVTHIAEQTALESEAEMRAAIFADDLLGTLRLYSDYYARSTNQVEWVDFWLSVASGDPGEMEGLRLTGSGLGVWQFDGGDFDGTGDEYLIYWHPTDHAARQPGIDLDKPLADHVMRYRLTISRQQAGETLPLTGNSEPPPAMVLADLKVWHGATRLGNQPYTFFTSFSNGGSLP